MFNDNLAKCSSICCELANFSFLPSVFTVSTKHHACHLSVQFVLVHEYNQRLAQAVISLHIASIPGRKEKGAFLFAAWNRG